MSCLEQDMICILTTKRHFTYLLERGTGVQTQYITKVIGKLKNIYKELYIDFLKKGYLEINHRIEEFNDQRR